LPIIFDTIYTFNMNGEMPLDHCFCKAGADVYSWSADALSFVMLLAYMALFLAAQPVHAEIYKWTDESGVIHYSGTPPTKTSKIALKRLSAGDLSVPQAKVPKSEVQSTEVQAVDDLNSKAKELKRQLDVEQQARQAAEAQNQAMQAVYAQALAEQQTARNVSYIPTVSSVVLLPATQKRIYSRSDNCVSSGAGMPCLQREHRQMAMHDKLR
jgi:hypothetical protein